MAYLPLANIDTDMIIPKQYLKTIKKTGLGKYLFAELRYDMKGQVIQDFVLNQQPDTQVLVAGDNFGCGSSREHAPWAFLDFGIRAIVAPSFADIFYHNCFKNGILLIKLSETDIETLVTQSQSKEVRIDLEEQSIDDGHHKKIFFSIEDDKKEILLQGLDDIERVLRLSQEVRLFEEKHFQKYPWLNREKHA